MLLNANLSLYLHIKIYTIGKHSLLITFLNKSMLLLWHTVKWFQVLYGIIDNSIRHQSFVYTQLNDQTIQFLTVQFSISHLFALSLDAKQSYLTRRYDPIRCYHSETEWNLERWHWSCALHSPNLQHYWSFTIILFDVISWTLSGLTLPLWKDTAGVFYSLHS